MKSAGNHGERSLLWRQRTLELGARVTSCGMPGLLHRVQDIILQHPPTPSSEVQNDEIFRRQ
jgi:hypothetical protein